MENYKRYTLYLCPTFHYMVFVPQDFEILYSTYFDVSQGLEILVVVTSMWRMVLIVAEPSGFSNSLEV